jgi:hypothetical protein
MVRGSFVGDGSWFAPLATAAEKDGEALYFRVGPSWASGRATRTVRVSLGEPHDRGDTLVVPLSWESSELPSLFPRLDGDLQLVPLDKESCRVTLSASYIPPLGALGGRLDRALLHRIARSTARSFLLRLAESFEGDAASN